MPAGMPVTIKRKADELINDHYESDEDSEQEELDEEEPINKKQKQFLPTSEAKKFKIPTAKEMMHLKETQSSFKSNLFRLQVGQVMKEITLDYPKGVKENTLKLKGLLNINDIPEQSFAFIIKFLSKKNIKIPFPNPAPTENQLNNLKFAFIKPANVFVVGSYLLKTGISKSKKKSSDKSQFTIDVAVQMPQEIFQEKDFLNHRYFYKRAIYLSVLASQILETCEGLELLPENNIKFSFLNGDEKRPIILLCCQTSKKIEYTIRIIPLLPESTAFVGKLSPTRNSIRQSEREVQLPTPRYNSSILMDTTFVSHLNLIHAQISKCPALKEAIMLAKLWIHQRGLAANQQGGFNGFLMSMIMAWLFTSGGGKRLMEKYSSFQIFKLTMEFIANCDFEIPLFLTENGKPLDNADYSLESFKSHFQVSIVDTNGRTNLAGHMTKSQINQAQAEAKLAVQYLNDSKDENFDALFLRPVAALHLRYDNLFRIPVDACSPPTYSADAVDFSSVADFVRTNLPVDLAKALNNRTTLIATHVQEDPKNSSWSISSNIPSKINTVLYIGMNLHQEHSLKSVEYGPSPEDVENVREFKRLWADKSELRRFKDGSIVESVVFENTGVFECRSLIVSKMVSHLISVHAGINENVSSWNGGNMFPFTQSPAKADLGETAISFKLVMETFDNFCKMFQKIDGLALTVSSVLPASSHLSYTSTFIPQPTSHTEFVKFNEPMEVVVRFEKSARWPDDFKMIQEMKLAFYTKIAEGFMKAWKGCVALVSCDDSTAVTATTQILGKSSTLLQGFIDITSPNGFTFRCRIHNEREGLLLEQAIRQPNAPPSSLIVSKHELEVYNYIFQTTPHHTSQIKNLCVQYPSLPHTIRLVKRWLSSHILLSAHIPEDVVELLCVSVYKNPAPWNTPASVFSGFSRVLNLISTHDWENTPLLVELENGGLSEQVKTGIEDLFNGARRVFGENGQVGGPSMFICTENTKTDGDGHQGMIWDRSRGNNKETLDRLVLLAKIGVKFFEKSVLRDGVAQVASLFATSYSNYDFIIHLDSHLCSTFFQALLYNKSKAPKKKAQKGFKNLNAVVKEDVEYMKYFNPVELYYRELKNAFSKVATFYYDKNGGTKICAKWNPNLNGKEMLWKINLGISSKIVSSDIVLDQGKKNKKGKASDICVMNNASILEEIQKLGEGLVLKVEEINRE